MDMPAKPKQFPLPSSLKVVPGTESAQAAYPYYTQFEPADDQRFWFYNSMHFPEPMSAFDMVTAEAAYCALGAANTRVHCLPTTLGIDHRIINGRVYIGGNAVTDPAEIARRLEEFKQRAFYYYANWERLYAQWREKMMALITAAQALPTPELPEFEPLANVHAGLGVASNHRLLDTYQKTLEGYFRMWHHHFEFLLLGYGAYLTFFDFCKKAFPEITDQTIARMVAGIEAEIFRPDDELRRLARCAVELGVRGALRQAALGGCSSSRPCAPTAMRGGLGSRNWRSRAIPGSTSTWAMGSTTTTAPGMMTCRCRSRACRTTSSGCRPARPCSDRWSKLLAERKQLIEDYRELLTTEDERAAYDQMITLAHRVFPYVEGHKFYCEHWYTNLFFNKIREFGALLAQHGFFSDAEDVFHLTHYELESAIIDLMTAWSNGSPPRGPGHWPQIVAERRAAIGQWAKHETPPALGVVPDVIDDPAIVMLWGITRESLDAWLSTGDDADPNELKGFAACRGVVEGTARIVKSVDEISRLQKGDILVCQVTNPTWAPIFSKISAAVSDIGGSMSHAAIVAREYGLPAVVGTGNGTSRIKDGQRIRVDGGRGIVTILQ